MKNESNLKRLFRFAGGYKYFTIASWVLSALSALAALLPFVFIWKVIKEVLVVAPNYGDARNLSHNGWMAMLSAVAAILIYIAALMCSHLAAGTFKPSAGCGGVSHHERHDGETYGEKNGGVAKDGYCW